MERLEAQAATEGDTMADLHFNTLARAQYLQGEDAELRSTLDRWRSLYPESRERDGWLFGWAAADARYADADSLLEAYVERHAEPGETRIEALRWRGYLEAARGRLGSARRFLGSARESLLRERGAEFEGLRVAAEMARLEMIAGDTSAALAGVRSALVETPLAGLEPPDRPYLDLARLYADAGDPRAATELLEEYRAETDSARAAFRSMPLLARASVAIAESHPGEALVLIDERPPFGGEERALQPLLRGRALAAMGRTADAIAAYEEYVGPRNEEKYRLNAFHLAEVLERLGALYDERGEPERAAEYYARFVELWEDAGPELQPRVEVARSRLEPLVAERGERSTPTGGRR